MRTYTIEGNMISWTGEVQMENSFGAWSRGEQKCFVAFTAETRDSHAYAESWCEPDDDIYAEIGLRFRGKELTEYDGIFCIPYALVLLLEAHGYDCEQMRKDLAGDGWEEIEGEDYILVNKNPVKIAERFTESELLMYLEVARHALRTNLDAVAEHLDMNPKTLVVHQLELISFLEGHGELQTQAVNS